MSKVTIDRESCISCASCWTECPSFFEENPDDSFSMIKEQFRIEKSIRVGEAPEDLAGCVQEAADLCPVQIIRVDV
jgi:ferredoxin